MKKNSRDVPSTILARAGTTSLVHSSARRRALASAACALRIEKVLNRLPGVAASVSFASESADVDYDPAQAGPQQVLDAIARAGFAVPDAVLTLALKLRLG